MIHGAGGSQRESLVHHLIVPGSFVVGVQQNVRMALDESGHERGSGEVDHVRTRSIDVWASGFDAVAADAYRPPFVHCFAVKNASGLEHGSGRGLARGASLGYCEEG